nr:upf0553 protein [Quercus suber]
MTSSQLRNANAAKVSGQIYLNLSAIKWSTVANVGPATTAWWHVYDEPLTRTYLSRHRDSGEIRKLPTISYFTFSEVPHKSTYLCWKSAYLSLEKLGVSYTSEGTDQEDFRESLVSQTGPDFSMTEVSMLPDHTIPAVTDDDSTLAVPRSEALDDTSVSQEPAGDVEKEESASREHRPSGTTVLDKTNPEDHSDPVVLTESSSSANHTIQSPSISTPDLSVIRLIEEASHSAGKLVNLLVKHLPSFRDETRFDGRKVRFYKRAQIFVADLWAATNGRGYGTFHDIDHLTMFADYRVPQILTSLGILSYSPPLHYAIKDGKLIPSGHSWEVQLRGCSIWGVELIRREILKIHPEAINVNAVLIDFFLYDLAKEREQEARSRGEDMEKCHRVRSIWILASGAQRRSDLDSPQDAGMFLSYSRLGAAFVLGPAAVLLSHTGGTSPRALIFASNVICQHSSSKKPYRIHMSGS